MAQPKLQGQSVRFPIVLWVFLLLILAVIFTFPKWITYFYPLPHKELVYSYSQQYEVDPMLIFALIRAESKFKSEATSKSGARGLMQIMPDTARWVAHQIGLEDFTEDQLSDPEVNIRLGCWYVSDLSREFNDNLPVVMAAYNAGRGNVRQWLNSKQWDGTVEDIENIPFLETRVYVRKVFNDHQIYQTIYQKSE